MIALLGALCAAVIFYGGGVFQAGDVLAGLGWTSLGVIGLGTIVAAIQSAGSHVFRFDTREGLTVRQLQTFIAATPWVTEDTKIYIGDTGLNIAGSVFSCLLDGGKALVIERKAVPGTPAAGAPHDLF